MSLFDNPDEYYMQQALREARAAADEDEIPVGAVIVSDERIIARVRFLPRVPFPSFRA